VAFQYQFEWDPAKGRQNARKHRVTFERGATVFKDPNALSLFDEEHSDEDERWITLGLDETGALLVISHTFDEEAENRARSTLDISAKSNKERSETISEEIK
jgi:uncharacterized DUF497 family protein